ncbi:SURF1 family protein [Salinisphaera orenii]|uniref:SURF1 family protein n=1 Tax=Salinisphaera orenii TaxID=856731 RepID=UPI000F4B5A79|nr:SURF1 family protein [Salinisphaera orenii]
MRVGRYRFAPPWWGVLVLILVAGALCGLGVWQIDRGETKQAMLAQRAAASQSAPTPLARELGDDASARAAHGQHYTLTGRVDASHQLLFDNQVFEGRVGYRVWTPVVLEDGRRVLVDRGWVPLGPGGRSQPPDPEAPTGTVTFSGRWRDLPEAGMRLGDGGACEQRGWPRVLNYPTIAQVRCQYDGPVAAGLLLMAEDAPGGFARDWDSQLSRMPPVRHYGYATQWFAMALAVLAIFVIVNLKRVR